MHAHRFSRDVVASPEGSLLIPALRAGSTGATGLGRTGELALLLGGIHLLTQLMLLLLLGRTKAALLFSTLLRLAVALTEILVAHDDGMSLGEVQVKEVARRVEGSRLLAVSLRRRCESAGLRDEQE